MAQPPTPAGKAYTSADVTVYFETRRCLHVAECVRGLPQVFDTAKRPWIQPDQAAAEQVAEVVRRCPTGALHYALTSGEPEQPAAPTVITPVPDGPLTVRGDLRIQTPAGEQMETRAALCRCGQSGNKPYCDGTHAKVGWTSE